MLTNARFILLIGFLCLLIGMTIFYLLAKKGSGGERFYTGNVICWVLIALFPTLLIFSLFPENSTITGNILGFSVTGAVALFVFIWWFGVKKTLGAVRLDAAFDRIRGLEDDLKKSQEDVPATGKPRQAKVLTNSEIHCFSLKKRKKRKIGLVTGNITGITCADIWVNSENTNMQMSRYFERSISGTIRYLGARKHVSGDVIEDLIMDELQKLMEGRSSVQPATVLITNSGELIKSHNVRKVFHVASVRGQVAAGYQPIENIESCVTNALRAATEHSTDEERWKSILFPLFGTGAGRLSINDAASSLVSAAIDYLEAVDRTHLETVYFITWTDHEFDACMKALRSSNRVDV